MAISRLNFRGDILGKMTSATIYLPEKEWSDSSGYPVLYLLHGRSDDCNTWLNATSLERYAGKYPFVIVMPQVELSYYTDMVFGEKYWSYLTKELPQKMTQWFTITQKPEHRFVAGLSMGGYGAFKWALQKPNYFKGAASLSGSLDVVSLWRRDATRQQEFSRVFGSLEELEGSKDDLTALVPKTGQPALCDFLQICGTEDFLYQDNQSFRQLMTQGIYHQQYHYKEGPGSHQWHFWDEQIQVVLERFNQQLSVE